MPFPKISDSTRQKICRKEVFCEIEPAREFLINTCTWLQYRNCEILDFILELCDFGLHKTSYCKEAHFDAANACAAVCRMLMEQNQMPTISKETRAHVNEEFEKDQKNIHKTMMENGNLDLAIIFVLSVCSANYTTFEHHDEAFFVQVSVMKVYRMIELQCEHTAA